MENFKYSYELRLRFVNPHQTGSFKEHADCFMNCVNEYNNAAQIARNTKKIVVLCVDSNYIDICLYSNSDLTKAPGRALMHLTFLLLNNDDNDNYYKEHLYYNKLFCTEQISISKAYESIPDVEFVKCLVEYISKPKSEISEKDKSTMNRIKFIAFENGLIKLNN